MKLNKKIALVLSIVMIAGTTVACSSGNSKSTEQKQESKVAASEYIGEEKAKEIMLGEISGAEIVEFELDEADDDGDDIIEYEAELEKDGKKYDISVDAKTGDIIEVEEDDQDDDLNDDVDDVDNQDDADDIDDTDDK